MLLPMENNELFKKCFQAIIYHIFEDSVEDWKRSYGPIVWWVRFIFTFVYWGDFSKFRLGKGYNPWALFNEVQFIILDYFSFCYWIEKKESASRDFGSYSKNSLCEFGILEAKLWPIEEKYLSIMSESSEELFDR